MLSKKILIVEDEIEIAKALEIRLRIKGYQTIIVTDDEEGWNKVRTEKPDLVILDIMLPKLNGYTLCDLIKKNKTTKKIPVIILTAKDTIDEMKTGLNIGADLYLNKPYEQEFLLRSIEKFIGK